MSHVWLPCGLYHQQYAEDQGWWQTPLIKGKMIFLLAIIFIVFPLTLTTLMAISYLTNGNFHII
jgi:branched-chain amino acid transport system permease protein